MWACEVEYNPRLLDQLGLRLFLPGPRIARRLFGPQNELLLLRACTLRTQA